MCKSHSDCKDDPVWRGRVRHTKGKHCWERSLSAEIVMKLCSDPDPGKKFLFSFVKEAWVASQIKKKKIHKNTGSIQEFCLLGASLPWDLLGSFSFIWLLLGPRVCLSKAFIILYIPQFSIFFRSLSRSFNHIPAWLMQYAVTYLTGSLLCLPCKHILSAAKTEPCFVC